MSYILVKAVDVLLMFIEYAILARVIISWLPIPKDNQIIRIIYQITEPILAPIRGMIERSALGRSMYMIDLSPIIAFLLLGVLRNIIIRILLF